MASHGQRILALVSSEYDPEEDVSGPSRISCKKVQRILSSICESEKVLLGRRPIVDILEAVGLERASAEEVMTSIVTPLNSLPAPFHLATGRVVVDIRSKRKKDIFIYIEVSYKNSDDQPCLELRHIPMYPDAEPSDTISGPAEATDKACIRH